MSGQLVTGPNGNSIFLPAAGYYKYSSLYYAGEYGYYWSSTAGTPDDDFYSGEYGDNPDGAYVLVHNFFRGSNSWSACDDRDLGESIRPVSE